MANPFDVAPPQWLTNLVGRPVDMTSVGTAIGGALSRRFNPPSQNDKFQALARARMAAQIEQINAHTAEETANAELKRKLIRDKTTAELQTAEWLGANGGGHQTILDAEIPQGLNSIAVDNIWKIKNQASIFGNRLEKTRHETGLNKALMESSAKNTDPALAVRISTLRDTVGKNGWTPEYQQELIGIQTDVNRGVGVNKLDYQQRVSDLKLAAQKELAGMRQDNALDRIKQRFEDQMAIADVRDEAQMGRIQQQFTNAVKLLKEKQAGVEVIETTAEIAPTPEKKHLIGKDEPAIPGQPKRTVKKTVTGNEPTATVKEIIRVDKNGKSAIFDAETKEFLRYAN